MQYRILFVQRFFNLNNRADGNCSLVDLDNKLLREFRRLTVRSSILAIELILFSVIIH